MYTEAIVMLRLELPGRRPRGRPKRRSIDVVEEDMKLDGDRCFVMVTPLYFVYEICSILDDKIVNIFGLFMIRFGLMCPNTSLTLFQHLSRLPTLNV